MSFDENTKSKISLKDPITLGSSLVALQPEGSKPVTYLVHGLAGHLLRIDQLSPYMAPDYPLYGVQAKGLSNEGDHSQAIEEIAADYVQEIQTYQPKGPYILGGFSFGGYVAYEMARQLHILGQCVALLAILDSPASTLPRYLESLNITQNLVYKGRKLVLKSKMGVKQRIRLRSRVRSMMGNDRPSISIQSNISDIPDDEKKTAGYKQGHESDPDEYMRREVELASPYQSLMDANISAMKKYAIHPYPGRITLFKAEKGWTRVVYGWEAMAAGGVEIQNIPGNHLTIFEEPNVQVLAAKLKACIARSIKG